MGDDLSDESQDWIVKKVGEHFQIINRETNKALNDPTTGNVGPTINVGSQLNIADVNEEDESQLWDIVPQGSEGYYNLLNVHSMHIANLNGGSANDGTPILSYTNDSKNGTSTNRLWYVRKNGSLPEEVDGIEDVREPEEYALAYNTDTKTLHFGSATPETLTFTVRVYTAGGQLIGSFRADETFSMMSQRPGIYIATWTAGGQKRSVKFSR